MIANAKISILQVVTAHRYLTVRTLQIVGFGQKAAIRRALHHLFEVRLDHCNKCKSNFVCMVQLSFTSETQ